MFLEKAIFVNRAPFDHLEISFKENGINVLSAVNGKGKTTILSHIADAFYELARKNFSGSFEGKENKFYRVSSSNFHLDINKYSIVYFRFKHDAQLIDYIDCRGKELTEENYDAILNLENHIPFKNIQRELNNNNCVKYFSNSSKGKSIFGTSILTYFPAYRYEQPAYLSDPYEVSLQFNICSTFNGYLKNPIEVVSNIHKLANWIMDVVLDGEIYRVTQNVRCGEAVKKIDLTPEKQLYQNLCRVLASSLASKYPSKNVRFGIGKRNNTGNRISIMQGVDQNTSKSITPSIFQLSSGELALLCIFCEIVRQADNLSINTQFSKIAGIVLIDEVDMHLHIKLQKEILPLLFNLFPKVQFIVSSHSPFLGMGLEEFAKERSSIFDLDNEGIECEPINNTQYQDVYKMMIGENNRFLSMLNELKTEIKNKTKTIIITEGKTDIRLINKAKEALGIDVEYDVITPECQPDGDSNLKILLKNLSKVRQPRKIIGIFDRDIDATTKELDSNENGYKDYGNNVYGFCIPLPESRKENGQEKISIEYLFSDSEIKSNVNESNERLFFGTEFSSVSGRHLTQKNLILCKPDGRGKDKIIESNGGQSVFDESDKNFLAKKIDFVEAVEKEYIIVSDDSWNNFRAIFDKIKAIENL